VSSAAQGPSEVVCVGTQLTGTLPFNIILQARVSFFSKTVLALPVGRKYISLNCSKKSPLAPRQRPHLGPEGATFGLNHLPSYRAGVLISFNLRHTFRLFNNDHSPKSIS